jgi:hypothetical protein
MKTFIKFNNWLFSKQSLILNLILFWIIISKSAFQSWYYLLRFDVSQGYKPDVFGFPKEYSEILSIAIFWLIIVITSIGLLINKGISWFVFQTIALASIIAILAYEIVSISKSPSYFNLKYFIILLGLLWMMILLNHKKIKELFFTRVLRKIDYVFILIGSIFLLTIWFYIS